MLRASPCLGVHQPHNLHKAKIARRSGTVEGTGNQGSVDKARIGEHSTEQHFADDCPVALEDGCHEIRRRALGAPIDNGW